MLTAWIENEDQPYSMQFWKGKVKLLKFLIENGANVICKIKTLKLPYILLYEVIG